MEFWLSIANIPSYSHCQFTTSLPTNKSNQRNHFRLILLLKAKEIMKTSHIFILVGIAIAIGVLLMYSVDFSTYDSIESAKQKQGKYVHLIAKLDKTQPVVYDALKDPNYLSFHAIDSLGSSTKVVYHNTKTCRA